MLRIAVGAIAAVAVLAAAGPAAAGPAAARERYLRVPVSVRGHVTATWHGDPARGCASAGLCGYRGSLTAPGSGSREEISLVPGQGGESGFSLFGEERPAVVRVIRDRDGSPAGGCADVDPDTHLTASIAFAGPGRLKLGIDSTVISSGRCAGPRPLVILQRLPKRALPLSRLRRHAVTVGLEGRFPYTSGRFSGTVVSTLRVRVGRVVAARFSRSSRPDRGEPPPSSQRTVQVRARYRVQSLLGSFTTLFTALPGPGCDVFDACEVTGRTAWGLVARGGQVVIDAGAPARASDRGLRGAIAAIRRGRGSVYTYGSARHAAGTVTAEVQRDGARDCRDTARVPAPEIAPGGFTASSTVSFALGDPYGDTTNDYVRTGCGGPTQFDVTGRHSLATGAVSPSMLARRAVEVELRGGGAFQSPGYSGTRTGRFTLVLRRVAARVRYSEARR